MPLHDKPVSNYPRKLAAPQCVVAWLKAVAYEKLDDKDLATHHHKKFGILIELNEARRKHEREGRL